MFRLFSNKIYFCYSIIKISASKSIEMPFYAVAKGRTTGIFMSWGDCEAQVKGFSGARYKKFDKIDQAQNFVENEGGKSIPEISITNSNSKLIRNNENQVSLKRNYATSSKGGKRNVKSSKEDSVGEQSFDSDQSDDLDTIIMKQMDDIETRLKGFTKDIDKIVKKKDSKTSRKSILTDPPTKRKKGGFEVDEEGFTCVYTDGACSSNGTRAARAGLGVFWGDGHYLNVSKPVTGRATNNCGEIQAATCAIKQALDNEITKLNIYTDSQFLINSVTKWMSGWKRKNWKLKSGDPVKNEKDFKELDEVQHKLKIKWNYVEAHRGIHGNEMADQLARVGAALYDSAA